MQRTRISSVLLGLAILCSANLQAQDDRSDEGKRPGARTGARRTTLIPARQLDALELTQEQRKKYSELEAKAEQEFNKISEKITELTQKGIRNLTQEERAKRLELSRELIALRTQYMEKTKDLLTDKQKETLEAQQPNLNRFVRNRPANPEQFQRQLELTEAQKAKLEKLREEFEKKQLEVLTDEQKKKFEELKKGRGRLIQPGVRPIQIRPIQPGQVQPRKIQIKPIQIQPGKIQPVKPKKVQEDK